MVGMKRSVEGCAARVRSCHGGRRVDHSHRRRTRRPVVPGPNRLFFLLTAAQHVKRPPASDWLAGVVLLLACVSWGLLAALLAQ
jgi:hypothetical protein